MIPNPRWILKNYKTTDVVSRLFTATTFNYQLTNDLNLIYKVGLDTYSESQRYTFNKGGVDLVNGFMATSDINNRIWDNSVIISYNKTLTEKFSFSARLGGNMRNDVQKGTVVTSQNQLPVPAQQLCQQQRFRLRNRADPNRDFWRDYRRL